MQEKLTAEDIFKEGLEATIDVVTVLGPYCSTFDELLTIVQLALDGESGRGQLNMLMEKVQNIVKKDGPVTIQEQTPQQIRRAQRQD